MSKYKDCMDKLNYKLIISDYDGTLLPTNLIISENTKDAINRYIEAGGVFAVSTGRMLKAILSNVRALGLNGLVSSYGGATIADIQTGEYVRNEKMAYQKVLPLIQFLEQLQVRTNYYCDDNFYTNTPKDDSFLTLYEQITGVTGVKIEGTLSQYVIENGISCQKLACLVPKHCMDEVFNTLCEKFGNEFDVTCSASVLIEIYQKGINKGSTLRYLANHYGIDISKTIAIGDNLNDLPMLVEAGLGVAVGNGVYALKERADFIAPTNDEEGVAYVINKFGFINND